MPKEQDLVPPIIDLVEFNSAEITDSRWDYDIARLLEAVDAAAKLATSQAGEGSSVKVEPRPSIPQNRDERTPLHPLAGADEPPATTSDDSERDVTPPHGGRKSEEALPSAAPPSADQAGSVRKYVSTPSAGDPPPAISSDVSRTEPETDRADKRRRVPAPVVGITAIIAMAGLLLFILVNVAPSTSMPPSGSSLPPVEELKSHLPSTLQATCPVHAPWGLKGGLAGTEQCSDGLTYQLWPTSTAAYDFFASSARSSGPFCDSQPAPRTVNWVQWSKDGRSGFLQCGSYTQNSPSVNHFIITWSIDDLAITGTLDKEGDYGEVLQQALRARDLVVHQP